jgi:hypothetical protein
LVGHKKYVYYVLAVEQMRSGNTTNGTMSKIGYEAMINGYEARAGLRHDLRQMRNRWNQLKGMYAWFKWATNQTGTGWLANGGIDAPNS